VPLPPGVPPPPGGFPGAPPLPGLFFGAPESTLPAREALEKPVKPLKKLHWETVKLDSLDGTAWADMLQNVEFDQKSFVSMFQRIVKKRGKKKRRNSQTSTARANRQISLLDSKREVNISIALNAFKMSVDRLCESITHIDFEVLTPERLISLINILPKEDEEKKIREFKGNPKLLSAPSLFHYKVGRIKNIRKRLEQVLFMSTLDSKTKEIRKNIRLLKKSLQALKSDENIAKILHLVLTLGNYMNFGSRKGNAYAFHLSLLQKLGVTKSTTGSSLLDWIIEYFAAHDSKMLKFTQVYRHIQITSSKSDDKKGENDTQYSLEMASKVESEGIVTALSKLRAKLKDLGRDLKKMAEEDKKAKEAAKAAERARSVPPNENSGSSHQKSSAMTSPNESAQSSSASTREPSPVPTNHFYKAMVSEFIEAAKKSKSLDKQYNSMVRTFQDTKKFYAVDDMEKPEELLHIFADFFASFEQSVFDYRNRLKRRRRASLKKLNTPPKKKK